MIVVSSMDKTRLALGTGGWTTLEIFQHLELACAVAKRAQIPAFLCLARRLRHFQPSSMKYNNEFLGVPEGTGLLRRGPLGR